MHRPARPLSLRLEKLGILELRVHGSLCPRYPPEVRAPHPLPAHRGSVLWGGGWYFPRRLLGLREGVTCPSPHGQACWALSSGFPLLRVPETPAFLVGEEGSLGQLR